MTALLDPPSADAVPHEWPAEAVSVPESGRGGRDAALDLLRALALGRVILWHAFAQTWMTVIAAMPLMFFIAGTLLPSPSTSERGYLTFVVRRARRLLLPFWAYGAAVAATLLSAGVALSPRWWSWIVPLVDPVTDEWHGGWLSNHLWYLRAYLGIVLLAPLFVAYARRLRLAVAVLLLGVVQLEVASALGVPYVGEGTTRVLVGDLVTYGLFVVLGVAYARRSGPLPRWLLAVGSAGAAAIGVASGVKRGLPPGGVNASYLLIACSGLALLGIVGLAEQPIRRVADVPAVRRASLAISRRAVTIYLWHPAAIVIAQATIGDAVPLRPAAVLAVTAALLAVALVGVGWVEDVASGRREPERRSLLTRIVPSSLVLPAAVAALALTVPMLVAPATATTSEGSGSARGLPPPSYREALGNSAFAKRAVPADAPFVLEDGELPRDELQDAIEDWVHADRAITRVSVQIVVQGRRWRGWATDKGQPRPPASNEPFRLHSLTKTFTMVLVMRAADAGRIDLDAPVPPLQGVRRPRGAAATITPRQLLSHTSGLADYNASPSYRGDRMYTHHQALNLALAQRLLTPPGTAVHYSNANYLWLGLLLEAVQGGRPYGEQVAELAASLQLDHTKLAPNAPGWVGYSAGGLESTETDVIRWGDALFTPGRVLSPARLAEVTTLGAQNVALGLWPLCPCGTGDDGVKRATAIGHEVGYGALEHYPQQMTVLVRMDPPSAQLTPHVVALGDVLRDVLRDR